MKSVPEILRTAAARVRQGWCQGEMGERHGNVCAMGAIYFQLDVNSISEMRTYEAVIRALRLPDDGTNQRFSCLNPIAIWNDAPGNTAEFVAQGLEFAAVFAEQEEAQRALAAQDVIA